MNVTTSIIGEFNAFHMANQLQKRNALGKIITSYPKFTLGKYGINYSNVDSLKHYWILKKILNRCSDTLKNKFGLKYWLDEKFDRSAAKLIPESTDIFVGWSSKSECCLSSSRELGCVSVLERLSCHIQVQRQLLREEKKVTGRKVSTPSQKVVEKEVREYKKADYISVPSKFARRSFLNKGFPKSKILKIPFGVDTDFFRPLQKNDDTFRITYAGQMSLRKGVHYLLRAFSELDLPNSELCLVGGSTSEISPYFEKYSESFRHVGHVSQANLRKYYSLSDVFAISSIEDGFGMVVSEAMACGLPVICTENVGASEIVRDGTDGFIIPIRDPDRLKQRIRWLYENPEACNNMGRKARDRVRKNFTWNDYGSQLFESYQEILSA